MSNLKKIRNTAIALVASIALLLTLSGCTGSSEYQERKDQQQTTTLESSLGIDAQKKRLEREENANTVRYVYLMSFGQIVGYYVIQGGVYDAGTQLAPEQEIICRWSSAESCQAVDSARDNGTYGGDDGGVFFFTSDGTLVETSLDYIQSDNPLPIDTPRLGGEKK